MKTIAVVAQKGGAGKTTLTIHLAVAAERAEKTAAVIDLDPQASATTWKDVRGGETPAVVPAQPNRLAIVLQEAEKYGAELAIIDTSPNSESASLAAARAADFVLIPCRPHLLDLQAISTTIELARIARKPFAVVLNAVPAKGTLGQEAATVLAGLGAAVAPVQLGHRAAYYNCQTKGQVATEYEPLGKAAEEVFQLYQWVEQQLTAQPQPTQAQPATVTTLPVAL
jgi:chromosome partitioning protein